MAFDAIYPDGVRVRTYSCGAQVRYTYPGKGYALCIAYPAEWDQTGAPEHIEREDLEMIRLEGMYAGAMRERRFWRAFLGAKQ